MRKHLPLTFQHRAGVRPNTSSYEFAESCVFSKQSPPPILCHLFQVALKKGTLYPEVTGSICRVPSTQFSQAPESIRLVHLCRFRVRFILEVFSWRIEKLAFFKILVTFQNPSNLSRTNSHWIQHSLFPQGPHNSTWISLSQKPLDLRRECFTHSLSLLMSAFSTLVSQASLTTCLP